MSSPPIIRFEIQQLKHTVHLMLSEHAAQIDEDLRRAVDDALKPENISSFIQEEVTRTVRSVLSDEIRSFFQYGTAGRSAIREAVHEHLEKEFSDLPPRRQSSTTRSKKARST